MDKKLYRTKNAGVCGGFANYIGMDPTIVRVAWAIISCFAGIGIVAYIVCALVVPEEPDYIEAE